MYNERAPVPIIGKTIVSFALHAFAEPIHHRAMHRGCTTNSRFANRYFPRDVFDDLSFSYMALLRGDSRWHNRSSFFLACTPFSLSIIISSCRPDAQNFLLP
jgi:hypothetical protein